MRYPPDVIKTHLTWSAATYVKEKDWEEWLAGWYLMSRPVRRPTKHLTLNAHF